MQFFHVRVRANDKNITTAAENVETLLERQSFMEPPSEKKKNRIDV